MLSKSEKHQQLERMRIQELKKREEEFEKRRQAIEQLRRAREQEETKAVVQNLERFDAKIKEGSEKHHYQI